MNSRLHLTLPAPAKLNLFLHITGQREDGYHNLQTIFHFLDYGDTIEFSRRDDRRIEMSQPIAGVPLASNLCFKAALLLQSTFDVNYGVNIELTKKLPIGGGLGGGSSNAATTLIALNMLWELDLVQEQLKELAVSLGADVPVFIHGHACWAEGIGDQLTDLELDECWYLVIHPPVHVSTAELFAAPELTRNCSPITIRDFLAGSGRNVFEPLVKVRYPPVAQALDWLETVSPRADPVSNLDADPAGTDDLYGKSALTGTGGCVFFRCQFEKDALNLLEEKPAGLEGFIAKGANVSLLHRSLASNARSL